MSLEKSLIQLRNEDTEYLKLFFREHTYQMETVLFYKDQTPTLSFLLTEGVACLKKNRKSIEIPKNSIIGVQEFFTRGAAKYQVTALPNSKILGLDSFTFKKFLNENPSYYEIFGLIIT